MRGEALGARWWRFGMRGHDRDTLGHFGDTVGHFGVQWGHLGAQGDTLGDKRML